MYNELLKLEKEKRPIRIAVIGAGGHQGMGICLQTRLTPGLKLVAAIDLNVETAKKAAQASGHYRPIVSNDYETVLAKPDIFDIMIEATADPAAGAIHTIATLEKGIPVILMNAEVDLLLGPLLHKIAADNNTVVSSDAGDQPGVLARMIDEIMMFGLTPRMIGNNKGFLNRYATHNKMVSLAEERHLNIEQCVSYTDGSKVNIEMALLANAFNAPPLMRGMEGPKLEHVSQVLDKFDFGYAGCAVEYILGAKPGGGVFIIAETHDKLQQQYLDYYKMGKGPRYLFYRPYHLCHLETPRAIVSAFLFKKRIMYPVGKLTDVFAFAKRDIPVGFEITRSIGSDEFYGLIGLRDNATELVPIALLENRGNERPVLKQSLSKDQPLKWYDVDLPDSELWRLYQQQEKLLEKGGES